MATGRADVTGVNIREIQPDKIMIDMRYRVRRPTWQEIRDMDGVVERGVGMVLREAAIEEKCVRLEEYRLQSACEKEEGVYDCFESYRRYTVTLPIDLNRVVGLLHRLPSTVPPSELEIVYLREYEGQHEIDCLEANALRNAQYRADILADAMEHHLGSHETIMSYDPPLSPSYVAYRMRRVDDLHLVTPALLSLPGGVFKLRFSLRCIFSTYSWNINAL